MFSTLIQRCVLNLDPTLSFQHWSNIVFSTLIQLSNTIRFQYWSVESSVDSTLNKKIEMPNGSTSLKSNEMYIFFDIQTKYVIHYLKNLTSICYDYRFIILPVYKTNFMDTVGSYFLIKLSIKLVDYSLIKCLKNKLKCE